MIARGILLIALGGALPAAAAGGVEAAREAYTSLDYESCTSAARQALDRPGSRQERVDAYRLLGLCEAALGDTEAARDAFVHLLAVDQQAELPDGLSPRFTSSFLEAKGEWVDRPPTGFVIERDQVEGNERTLRLTVNDRLGIIEELGWRTEDGELHDRIRAAERMEVVVPKDVARELVGFDRAGGEVTVLPLQEAAAPAAERELEPKRPKEPGEAEAEASSILTSPWLWLGVSAVGATVVVMGAAAAGLGIAFYEPRQVTLQGDVVFADDLME